MALRLTRRMRIKLGTPDTRVEGKPAELTRALNWPLFYYHFQRDHAKPDLIWNLRVRVDDIFADLERGMVNLLKSLIRAWTIQGIASIKRSGNSDS